jgi:uncharacterized membrane protein
MDKNMYAYVVYQTNQHNKSITIKLTLLATFITHTFLVLTALILYAQDTVKQNKKFSRSERKRL